MSAPAPSSNNVKQLYTAWVDYADKKGGEKAAFRALSAEEKKTINSAIKVLISHKNEIAKGKEFTVQGEDLDYLGTSFSEKSEQLMEKLERLTVSPISLTTPLLGGRSRAALGGDALVARVAKSFEEIYPIAKAESVLMAKFLPLTLLNESKALDKIHGNEELGFPGTIDEHSTVESVMAELKTWAKSQEAGENRGIALRALAEVQTDVERRAKMPKKENVAAVTMDQDNLKLLVMTYKTNIQREVAASAERGLSARDLKALQKSTLGGKGEIMPGIRISTARKLNDLQEDANKGLKKLEKIASTIDSGGVEEYREAIKAQAAILSQMEELVEPYALNTAAAAIYADVSKQKAAFFREHVHNLALLDQGLPSLQEQSALRSTAMVEGYESLDASETNPKTPALERAFELEKRAMVWAKYAADQGSVLGSLIVVNLYREYADWSTPESAQLNYRKAADYIDKALESSDSVFKGGGVRRGEVLLAQGHLASQRFLAAIKGNESQEQIENFEETAIKAYKRLGKERGTGLFELTLMGSTKAANALMDIYERKYPEGKFKGPGINDSDLNVILTMAAAGDERAVALLGKLESDVNKRALQSLENAPKNDKEHASKVAGALIESNVIDAAQFLKGKRSNIDTKVREFADNIIEHRAAITERPSEAMLEERMIMRDWSAGEELVAIIGQRYPGSKLYNDRIRVEDQELLQHMTYAGVMGAKELLDDLAAKNENKELKGVAGAVERNLKDSNFITNFRNAQFAQPDLAPLEKRVQLGDWEAGAELIKMMGTKYPDYKISTDQSVLNLKSDLNLLFNLSMAGVEGAQELLDGLKANNENEDVNELANAVETKFNAGDLSREEVIEGYREGLVRLGTTAMRAAQKRQAVTESEPRSSSSLSSSSSTSSVEYDFDEVEEIPLTGGEDLASSSASIAGSFPVVDLDSLPGGEILELPSSKSWGAELLEGLKAWFSSFFASSAPATAKPSPLELSQELRDEITAAKLLSPDFAIDLKTITPEKFISLAGVSQSFYPQLTAIGWLIDDSKDKKAAVQFLTNQLWRPLFGGTEKQIAEGIARIQVVQWILENRKAILNARDGSIKTQNMQLDAKFLNEIKDKSYFDENALVADDLPDGGIGNALVNLELSQVYLFFGDLEDLNRRIDAEVRKDSRINENRLIEVFAKQLAGPLFGKDDASEEEVKFARHILVNIKPTLKAKNKIIRQVIYDGEKSESSESSAEE